MGRNSKSESGPKPRLDRRLVLIVCLLMTASIGIAYWRAPSLQFISVDDPHYVTSNPHVKAGLSWEGIRWAFTASRSANWHPLTWISHQADWELFGDNPTGPHLVNLALHILNTILLFIALRWMTGSAWRSAFVAAVFGLHPLRVESVAWVAERKDVLSGLFWMLTMLAYARYAERRSPLRYVIVAAALALGLMAKPMLVSLPIVLLLLDLWPLGRSHWPALLREKWLLLVLVAASCAVTFWVQQHGGAVRTMEQYPLGERIANALVSYLTYAWKTVWPVGLSIIYPHPENTLPVWLVALSAAVLAVVTYATVAARRSRGYLAVGWFWYLITLIPVIGIVQVGRQGMADRYAYIPLIGLSIIVAWGVPELLRGIPKRTALLAVGAVALLIALTALTCLQMGYWQSSEALLRRAVRATSGHPMARYCLADVLTDAGRYDEAVAEFDRALAIDPRMAVAHAGAAGALEKAGRLADAEKRLREAIRLDGRSAMARNNLGQVLLRQNRLDEAERELRTAVRLDPGHAQAEYNLGIALQRQGKLDAARAHLRAAIRLDPDFAQAHCSLGAVMLELGDIDAALKSLDTAIKLDPEMPQAHYALAVALYQSRDLAGARRELRIAQRLGVRPDPRFVDALSAGQGD